MLPRDFISWSSIIRNCCFDARHHEVLSLFLQKFQLSVGFKPDNLVFAAVFKSCAALSAINMGKALHGYAVKQGDLSCQSVQKGLLNVYAKCGAFDDSWKLFEQFGPRDVVTWNIILSGYSWRQHDTEAMRLFVEMHIEGEVKPNAVSIATLLPICARAGHGIFGKTVHCYAIKSGVEMDTLVGNALVSMYAKSTESQYDAYATFNSIIHKDVVSWNAIISALAEKNLMFDALQMFILMLKEPTEPNYVTIANILPVCASFVKAVSYSFGREIHGYVQCRTELIEDVSVCNALMSFYMRIGQIEEAEILFGNMKLRDLVSWNTLISGYALNDEWLKALNLFCKLLCIEMIEPDSVTIVSVLPSCAQSESMQMGRMIHGYILRHPILREDSAVGNALISFYAKFHDVKSAFQTFSLISKKDLISWNSMLNAFIDSGHDSQFLHLIEWMLQEKVRPDSFTILSIIGFCVSILGVRKVKETHCYSVKACFLAGDSGLTIANSLLDAYSKCDDIDYAFRIFKSLAGKRNLVTCNSMISGYVNCKSPSDALTVFSRMSEKDLTTWNLMLRVYAENNCPAEALSLFCELQTEGLKPDAVTIMSLLPSCNEMASFHLLKECHGYSIRSCFEDVYLEGALVDAYSKCGIIGCAYKLFQSSSQKDLVMFTSMISGYAMHGMGEEALKVFDNMLEFGVKPDHVVMTAVLSACSHTGLVNQGLDLFHSMEEVHHIKPTMEQYACVVDLLSRGGRITDAYSFVIRMPIEPDANIWATLLGACKTHHEVELGVAVGERLFEIEADDIGNYIVMSNLYAADAKWDGVLEVRRLMRARELKKPAGCSWIEVEGRKNFFVAGDSLHPQRSIIYSILNTLHQQIRRTVNT